MKKSQRETADVYGEQLWSYYQTGHPKYEIIERDDGFISVARSGARLYFAPYRQWPAFEREALRHARGRVLDVGCGAARHSLYLQGKGLDVTGIDSSPLSVRVARLRGLRKARVLPIEDIGTFAPDSFDTVLMMGNNFGLFGTLTKARRLLRQLHRITAADAAIIAGTTDTRGVTDPADRAYLAWNRRRGRLPGQVRIRVRYRNLVGSWFDYLLVSRRELATILEGTGWKAERFFGAEEGSYAMMLAKR